ncbi:uncharacterized protein BDCG_16373 [Blastomyces dermatitidis ER-3]|uniref:Uncharacterized protein n=1 Tax=Ajellomyces dermatitidis (strain ER-3 / ATCC MYA-2586) TaxID=559297 RepID=A0ABX2VRN1_AJEDR|nr:uncharacterized protein BDCG_16373 [Blastomyces dermatitidis ER-3]EQL30679.1 hypothetical protein BDFG_06833 [Blastomyces dermatitidis ATCC 26199]OAS99890.1 hypothetical protein BDCG_16373 [Blastomyces dermatitidis ER-3]
MGPRSWYTPVFQGRTSPWICCRGMNHISYPAQRLPSCYQHPPPSPRENCWNFLSKIQCGRRLHRASQNKHDADAMTSSPHSSPRIREISTLDGFCNHCAHEILGAHRILLLLSCQVHRGF